MINLTDNIPRNSQDGKAHRKSSGSKKSDLSEKVHARNRPKINVDIEGILKGELIELLTIDRTKLLTAEQQKVLWKKDEKVRDSERRVAIAIEKQRKIEEEHNRQALEELYANVTKQKLEARRSQWKAKRSAELAKRKPPPSADEVKTDEKKVLENIQQPNEQLIGEDDEQEEGDTQRKSMYSPKKYQNTFGPPVLPNTELPGEFGDAEWSEAEGYGYSRNFPYQKNEKIIHKGEDSLPPYVPPETASSNEQMILDGDEPFRGPEYLHGFEEALFSIDKAATSLQTILGNITSRMAYMPRTPANTATAGFAYQYTGESEMNIQVETDIKEPSLVIREPKVPKDTLDKATQVRAIDILQTYRQIDAELGRKSKRSVPPPDEEGEFIILERKPSQRVDDSVLTRPVGYKELELSLPMDAITFEAQTQVRNHEIDQEFALERGIILPKDDILWPTVAEFDLEIASKRLQDYIDQCWTLDPKWMVHVYPVQTIADDFRKRFVLEAKFSVPTALNPVPAATASVFFIFDISHYAAKHEFVKVHYVVEGTRFVHAPGTLPFQDKWLWSIISDKVRVQRSIDF